MASNYVTDSKGSKVTRNYIPYEVIVEVKSI